MAVAREGRPSSLVVLRPAAVSRQVAVWLAVAVAQPAELPAAGPARVVLQVALAEWALAMAAPA